MKKYLVLKILLGLIIACVGVAFISGCKKRELETQYYSVTYSVEEGGRIEGDSEQRIEGGGIASAVTALPNTGYKFVGWSDGIDTAERTDKNISGSISVTAKFEKQNYILKYETDGNGYIKGKATQAVAYNESAIKVTAVPNIGYQFVKWSDGVKTAERTDKNITSDNEVKAIFEKLFFIVEYESLGNGELEGETTQSIEYGKDASLIRAIPDVGYEFVMWTDGETEAVRSDKNIKNNISVFAIFKKRTLQVRYSTSDGGKIRYITNKELVVEYGESGGIVRAVPYDGYIFIKWSDGVLTPERQEINVTEDIEVTALFGYSVEYKVDGGHGGKIVGDTFQMAMPNERYKEVIAVANKGYVFCGWSDKLLSCERLDNSESCLEYVAYFEPIEKTFNYNYGASDITQKQTSITITRDALQYACFDVPKRNNFTFCGWYTDNKYTTKIADETGNLMLGFYTFALEADTIYAKWRHHNDDTIIHKVLLVMVDEIHASLYSTETENFESVDYKMSAIERNILALIPSKVSKYLNDCFAGQIVFEVDTYFTTISVNTECFRFGSYAAHTNYSLEINKVLELGKFLNLYHNILLTFGLNDYSNIYHYGSGIASTKYGNVNLEELFSDYVESPSLHLTLDDLTNDEDYHSEKWGYIVCTFIHEFTHTVEMYYGSEIYEYHKALKQGGVLIVSKKYLTGTLEVNEENVGIPVEYWHHRLDIPVNYISNSNNYGKVILLDESYNKNYVTTKIIYGGEISVKAMPNEGYRFLRWSDGITTAIRHDTNIISYLNVEAIFIEI